LSRARWTCDHACQNWDDLKTTGLAGGEASIGMQRMKFRFAISIVSVQVAWLACAYGATSGYPSIGVAACVLAIAVNLMASDDRWSLMVISLLLGSYGALTESIWAYNSIILYSSPGPLQQFAPIWIIALWMAFGGMIHPAFSILIGRPIAAALLGATMAPGSYLAASQLGALELSEPNAIALLAIAVQWGLALPTAVYAREVFSQKRIWFGRS